MRPEVKYGILAGVVVLLVGSIGYVVYQSSRTDKPPDVAWLKDRGAASTEPNKVATPGAPTAAKPGPTPVTPGGRSTTPPPAPVRGPNTLIATGPNTPSSATQRPASLTPPPVTTRPAPMPTVLPPLTQPATTRPAPTGGPITSPPATATPSSDANAPVPSPGSDPLRRPPGPVVQPPAPAAPTPGESTLPKPPDSARPGTPAAGARSHKVAAGESLWVIAERYYGDGNLWKRIKEANPSVDENRLFEGQSLVIPPRDGPSSPAPAAKPDAKPKTGADPIVPAAEPSKPPSDPNKPKTDPNKPKVRRATYRVEAGDTLVSIARTILKDGERWREIYELNKERISNPDRLFVGTELRLPE